MTVVVPQQTPRSTLKPRTPWLADAASLLIYLVLGGWLLRRFAIAPTDIPDFADQTDESVQLQVLDGDAFTNLLLLIALYFLFLVGFYIIRKLHGTAETTVQRNRPLHIINALLFGLGMTMAMTELTAFFDNIDTIQGMGEVGNGYIIMFTPAIFIFVSLLYLFLLIMPPELVYGSDRTAGIGLVLTNMLMIGIASYLVGASGRILPDLTQTPLFLLTMVVLLILFALPRLYFASRTRQPLSIVSFALTAAGMAAIATYLHL